MFYFIMITLLVLIFRLILAIKEYSCCLWTKVKPLLSTQALLSTLFMLFFEGYLEILISCLLSIYGEVLYNGHDKLSYRVSQILPIILFTIIPFIIIYVLFKNKKELNSIEFKQKYGEIFPNLRIN